MRKEVLFLQQQFEIKLYLNWFEKIALAVK